MKGMPTCKDCGKKTCNYEYGTLPPTEKDCLWCHGHLECGRCGKRKCPNMDCFYRFNIPEMKERYGCLYDCGDCHGHQPPTQDDAEPKCEYCRGPHNINRSDHVNPSEYPKQEPPTPASLMEEARNIVQEDVAGKDFNIETTNEIVNDIATALHSIQAQTIREIVKRIEEQGKCFCGKVTGDLADGIHTDGCSENMSITKRIVGDIRSYAKDKGIEIE